MNNLRNAKTYIVGNEILADVSLPEFLDQFQDLLDKFESKDIVSTLKKLKRKLETLDRCFQFTKAQKLYEKNLIKMQNGGAGKKPRKGFNTSFASSDHTFTEASKDLSSFRPILTRFRPEQNL